MLDSDQEPSYNLSKNLLLLPRILKLIKHMVDDSTPLLYAFIPSKCTHYCISKQSICSKPQSNQKC